MYPNEKNMFIMPNHEKSGDYHESPSLSHLMMNIDSKENRGNKSFPRKAKASKPCIPKKRMCLLCTITKDYRLSRESKFIPFDG